MMSQPSYGEGLVKSLETPPLLSLIQLTRRNRKTPANAGVLRRRARDSNPQHLTVHLTSNPTPKASNAGEHGDFQNCAAQGAAGNSELTSLASDLQTIIGAWPTLSESTKWHVMVLIRAGHYSGS